MFFLICLHPLLKTKWLLLNETDELKVVFMSVFCSCIEPGAINAKDLTKIKLHGAWNLSWFQQRFRIKTVTRCGNHEKSFMWAWIDEQSQRQTSFEQVGKNETQETEKEKKSVRKTSAGATKFSFFCEENHFCSIQFSMLPCRIITR